MAIKIIIKSLRVVNKNCKLNYIKQGQIKINDNTKLLAIPFTANRDSSYSKITNRILQI